MLKKLRFYYRLGSAYLVRFRMIVLSGFILGILAFFFIPSIQNIVPQNQKTKAIGMVGRYTTENIPSDVLGRVSLGLTRVEKDGTPLPSLAREWKISNDGKVYTFKLFDNLKWHDGKKIYARDINYNFEDVRVNIIDDKTIEFTLQEPFSPFPVIVSKPLFKKGLVGVGAYKIKKITYSGRFIETILLESTDKINPSIIYHFYPTESALKTGFKLGEVDIIKGILNPADFNNWKNIKIDSKIRFDQYVAVFLNLDNPKFKEKSLRQALAYAIFKEKNDKRAPSPISPSSWSYNTDVKKYEEDLQHAKELLNQVQEGKKSDEKITIKLTTALSLFFEAEKIREAWTKLGLKVDVEPFKSTENQEIEALLAIQEIPIDPDQYSLWHSSQNKANITHFNNQRIDKLLEDGRKTYDLEKRKSIYWDFQKFLVEEVPAVFLFYPEVYEISRI